MQEHTLLEAKYSTLLPLLDERSRRLILAADALAMGRGGKMLICKLSGASRSTLNRGIKELQGSDSHCVKGQTQKIRKAGGGRKKTIDKDERLAQRIEEIVAPHTMGNPMAPLRWTSKSFRKICVALKQKGHKVSHQTTGEILKQLGYSIQQNKKTKEGGEHPDRDTQFLHINDTAATFLEQNDPVISVDCKKKELIGNYKNAGAEWAMAGQPMKVNVYDFEDKALGKAIPYGLYETAGNEGYVSVGISHDTAAFAVATIRSWWNEVGKEKFGRSKKIYITADGGGSNSSRSRLWKSELQGFANESGLEVSVSHYPPGTSKWNKIEHRLFSYISINWRAKPLISLQVVIDLIASTTTEKGLKVKAKVDNTHYPKGLKITEQQLSQINLLKNAFHGEGNYTIKPNIV
ncbi:MAG: ISAzo13 family transposase [Flavisolibacter sp.]|nr:ISAzo13 family transposase [Flavisolibacter sp.]